MSSARFSFECKADPKTTYTVYCSIAPVNVPKQFLGLYSGSVSNTVGSIDIKFQIRKEDSAVVRNLTLNGTTKTVTVKGEDRVTLSLNCWAYGQPAPKSLTIYKDNIAVTASEVQYRRTGKWDYMAMVTLSEVQCRDKGTYTCTTDNGIGDPDSRSISLNVTYAPQQILPATLNPVDDGISFKLKACPIPETFVFTHHGNIVDKGGISVGCEKDTVVDDSAVSCLIAPRDVPKQELGSYTVAVSNGVGSVDIMFTIHEEDRAVITNLTLNNASETLTVTGDVGVTLYIICNVFGRPVPEYVLITRGYTTFGPRDVQYQRTGNWTRQAVVTLPAVQCGDMGAYTCEAENGIVGSDTRTIQLNVECPPRKIFDDTLTMKDGRLAFSLAAYPVPDRFVFFHLSNLTSVGLNMSGKFSGGCEQDRITEFTVNCEVTFLDRLQNVEGLYMAEMYNDLGKVEVKFSIQEREDKPLMGQWAALGAVGFIISIAIVVAVTVICRRRNNDRTKMVYSLAHRISGLYEEIDENAIRGRHRVIALLVPSANRSMPQLPEAGVPIRIIDEQRHIDAVQNRPLPSTPDAGASFSTDHEQNTLQAEEMEMGALGGMISSGNDYDQAQQTTDNDDYMYSPLETSSCSQSNEKEDPTSAEPDDASATGDYYLHPIVDSPSQDD
ncbi:uncharacterized protein [Littorina saxatilis]|uniref:Ig-like domain-containing protein n=1 Tax=Littorina saxatilis TaxID=31220 RepID=A0AAN9GFH4_9CAEN